MKCKGSITVFAALSLLLTASFLFALLEGARVQGLNTCAELVSEVGITSVCAEYQSPLWEDYRLLFLDGAYGMGDFSEEKINSVLCQRISENLDVAQHSGSSMYGLSMQSAQVTEYQLASDGKGAVFLQCVAAYMEHNLAQETIEKLYERYREGEEVEKKDTSGYSVEGADQAIEEAKKAQEEAAASAEAPSGDGGETSGASTDGTAGAQTGAASAGGGETAENGADSTAGVVENPGETGGDNQAGADTENPLEIVLKLKENLILEMTAGNVSEISTKQVDLRESMQKRSLKKGTQEADDTVGWYERVLVGEYLDSYFSNYRKPKEEGAFSYELEYLLCGEDTDKSNLEGTINRLMLLREGANIICITMDSAKMNQAKVVAEAIAAAVAQPELITVIQCGIVAAWAYVESLLDLRALLRGNKIALVKSREQWTTNTENLMASIENDAKAMNCENGLTYEEYLKLFLYMMGTKKLAYRMMDVMEQSLRLKPGYEHVHMDHMICELSCSIQYQAAPLFANLSLVQRGAPKGFCFEKEKHFSYKN